MFHEEPPSSPLSDAPSDLSAFQPTLKKPQLNGNALQQHRNGTEPVKLQPDRKATASPSGPPVKQKAMAESLRPSRKRTAPKKFVEEAEESPKKKLSSPRRASSVTGDDFEMITGSSSPTKEGSKRKQPLRGDWSVQHLMTSAKSKLVTANVAAILNDDRAWTELTREQQEKLISLLPGASISPMPEGEALPNVAKMFLREHSSFQAGIRQFQEDLDTGRYEHKWLEDAQKAMQKRANGDFDTWKSDQREQFWGQKQKINWNAAARESSQHDLPTLVKAGYVKVDDVWHLRRAHGRGHEAVVVQKEATVTGISSDNLLSFRFAPGQQKLQTHGEAMENDIKISDVSGPHTLSTAILNEDGRIVGVRGPNAWQEFRCWRDNQDMGSIWDLRELYHSRQPG